MRYLRILFVALLVMTVSGPAVPRARGGGCVRGGGCAGRAHKFEGPLEVIKNAPDLIQQVNEGIQGREKRKL